MTDALVAFLRARLDEQLEKARFASSTVAKAPERFGVDPEQAAAHARFSVATAEVHLALLEDTVIPHLGAGGAACRVVMDRAAYLTFYSSSSHGRNSPCLYAGPPDSCTR